MTERVTYDERGRLDEVVTTGGAHLERIGKRRWFLEMQRADGSSVCLWFRGEMGFEERPAATEGGADG